MKLSSAALGHMRATEGPLALGGNAGMHNVQLPDEVVQHLNAAQRDDLSSMLSKLQVHDPARDPASTMRNTVNARTASSTARLDHAAQHAHPPPTAAATVTATIGR